MRSLGSGVATAVNWTDKFVMGLMLLPLMDVLTPWRMFCCTRGYAPPDTMLFFVSLNNSTPAGAKPYRAEYAIMVVYIDIRNHQKLYSFIRSSISATN